MFATPRKRPQTPFQPFKEVTIPPNAVCGGYSSGSTSTDQYGMLIDQPKPQVDPIQVGPTG